MPTYVFIQSSFDASRCQPTRDVGRSTISVYKGWEYASQVAFQPVPISTPERRCKPRQFAIHVIRPDGTIQPLGRYCEIYEQYRTTNFLALPDGA